MAKKTEFKDGLPVPPPPALIRPGDALGPPAIEGAKTGDEQLAEEQKQRQRAKK